MSMTKTVLGTFFNFELDLVLSELTKEIIILRTRLMIDVPVVLELKQQNIFCSNAPYTKRKEKLYYLQSILLSLQ